MKKVIKKDKKVGFKLNLLFQYCKSKWYFLLVFMMLSCTVQNHINKEDCKPIPENLSLRFYDDLDSIVSQYDGTIRTKSFVKDFSNLNTINFSKPITLEILDNKLFLKFFDNNNTEYVIQFYGKRYKKKFVFYTNYETISFPVLFISKQMTKYSVYLSGRNEIIFENNTVNEGMLLFFGAGNSSKLNYKFKILKNE